MKKLFAISFTFLFIIGFFSVFAPSASYAQGIIPCGGAAQPSCTFCHIFELLNNIITFLLVPSPLNLFPIVLVAAALLFALGGFFIFVSAGNTGKLEQGKKIITATVTGLLIVYGAWLFVSLLLTSMGVMGWTGLGSWWKIPCSVAVVVPVPAPMAHWKFDENSGTIAFDSAGINHATLAAAPADPAWVPAGGKVGGALEFDGNLALATYDLVDLPFTLGSEPKFTVSAWIKSTNGKGESTVIGPSGSIDFRMGVQSPAATVLYRATPGCLCGGWENLYVPIASPIGAWHQMTFVYDDTAAVKAKLYYDGVSSGGAAESSNPKDLASGKPNWQLGEGSLDPYNGLLDEIKIWKQALTDAEVLAEFNSY